MANPCRIGPFRRGQLGGGGQLAINPLSLTSTGVVYLNSLVSFSGLPHGTVIGVPASTEWPNLYGQAPSRNAVQTVAGQRPVLQVTSNQSPSGAPLVRFDGLDDQLFSTNPAPWPAGTLTANTFLWFGRIRRVSAPPAPFSLGIAFADNATGSRQLGYEANPGLPPYKTFGFALEALDTATWPVSVWGGYTIRLNPPRGSAGLVDSFYYRGAPSGSLSQSALSPDGWDFTGATHTGYLLGGNLVANGCPSWDLGTFLWVADNLTNGTILAIFKFWQAQFGME